MMNAAQLCDEIRRYCRRHADKAVAEKYARYFTEGYDAYGLSDKLVKDKVRTLVSDPNLTTKTVLAAANSLVKSGKYEETGFAICLLREFRGRFDAATFSAVESWFGLGIVNWAHCDILCSCLLSVFFSRDLLSPEDLCGWRTAQNKYQRRAVPVAMLNLLKTSADVGPLLAFIEPMMMDPEHTVQQGLGWFLREAWKTQPKPTERFLLKWKDAAPRTIFQYATEKMTPDEKKHFKRKKV